MQLAPIVLFTYDRALHLHLTVEALKCNKQAKQSDLFIFSDAAKNEVNVSQVEAVRKYLKKISGFKSITIVEREENLGLTRSIISGITDVVKLFGQVIVLEDDLVTSRYFLSFMNEALDFYRDEPLVGSIGGYVYPLKEHFEENFFLKSFVGWGWATWKDRWDVFDPNAAVLLQKIMERKLAKKFDLGGAYPFTQMLKDQADKKGDTWDIQWYASLFLADKLNLFPPRSIVKNIGVDSSGVHCGASAHCDVELFQHAVEINNIPLKESDVALNAYKRFFSPITKKRRRLLWFTMKDAFAFFIRRYMSDAVSRFLRKQRINCRLFLLRSKIPISRVFGFDRGVPIDRYYIEKFLELNSDLIKGVVLEIGDDVYTRSFGGIRVIKNYVLHATPGNNNAIIIGDLTNLPQVEDNLFDCIILTQTLQFIYDVKAAIKTIYRILKPGGIVLATVPGISQIRRYDMNRRGEYWRFTDLSAKRLFGEFFLAENIEVKNHGNVLVAVAFLHGLAAHELKQKELDCYDQNYQVLITIKAIKSMN